MWRATYGPDYAQTVLGLGVVTRFFYNGDWFQVGDVVSLGDEVDRRLAGKIDAEILSIGSEHRTADGRPRRTLIVRYLANRWWGKGVTGVFLYLDEKPQISHNLLETLARIM